MKLIYVVQYLDPTGVIWYQIAFACLEEAEKCRDAHNRHRGASSCSGPYISQITLLEKYLPVEDKE